MLEPIFSLITGKNICEKKRRLIVGNGSLTKND